MNRRRCTEADEPRSAGRSDAYRPGMDADLYWYDSMLGPRGRLAYRTTEEPPPGFGAYGSTKFYHSILESALLRGRTPSGRLTISSLPRS